MAVTARESSNGRSPGAAMIPSTRVLSAARRTIARSFSAHSPRSASAACAASMAALASSPAHETTSWRAAAVSAIASEKPALRRQRPGAARRSASGNPGRGSSPASSSANASCPCQHVSGHAGEVALHLVDLVPAGLPLVEPVQDGSVAALPCGVVAQHPPARTPRSLWAVRGAGSPRHSRLRSRGSRA